MVNEIKLLPFEMLCDQLMLGEILEAPVPLTGGLLHRMYALQTASGRYAVKALNPEIMRRPTAMHNFMQSERIANWAASVVPALPAKPFNGTSIQKAVDQYFLLFDWIEGRSLKPSEIKPSHSEQIGEILSHLHKADCSELGIVRTGAVDLQLTDWNYYLTKGRENASVWVDFLSENIENLYAWNKAANDSAITLASDMVISHGDLDSKNVMWQQDHPILIDWESAGYRNPMQDLVETALYWSELESGQVDKDRFSSFIGGYTKSHGPIQADWRAVLAGGFEGKLGWLEYSLKRSLGIECADETDQQAGTTQASDTIRALRSYDELASEIEEWLRGLNA